MRYALKFAYDGTAFDGYARQPDHTTIEGAIIHTMKKEGIVKDIEGNFYPASRTDKGVSALGNVLVIETDVDERGIIPALNSDLKDIVFYGMAKVDEDFKPRYAYQRWYRYFMLNKGGYDADMLSRISDTFLGEHEFKHFSKTDKKMDKTKLAIDEISIHEENGFIIFDLKARRFLWQMIRRLVSTILSVYDGKLELEKIVSALEGNDEKLAIYPVPPEGLILMDIDHRLEYDYTKYPIDLFDKGIEKALTKAMVLSELNNGSEG